MSSIRVLYIGDHEAQREVLAEELNARGCAVAVSPAGAEGLAAIRAAARTREPLEVVICDYQLQHETGLEVLAALRQIDSSLPLIILTSHGSIPLGVEAIKQGAFQFITKPYDADALMAVVEQAQEHRLMSRRGRDLERKLREQAASLERANTELATSTEVLQAILDSSPTSILMVGSDGRITASNRATAEMFSLDGASINGTSIDAFLERIACCFADREAFARLVEQLKRDPDVKESSEPDHALLFERMLETASPERRFLSLFCAPVGDRRGRELGRVWVCSDVTQLKLADEQLHMIVDLSPVPLIITRTDDGEILFANEPLGELVGVPPAELVGQRSPDFYCRSEDRDEVVARVIRDGEVRNHEVCFKRKGGEPFWALLSLVKAEIDGRPALIGAVNDIDQRKRAEEALLWERNFVSAILDTASALVVVLDAEGRVVRFNRACQQTSGYALDEVVGKHYWELFCRAGDSKKVRGVFAELKAGSFPTRDEGCWCTKDGAARLIEWSNTALTDAEGEVEYIVSTGIDVTERRAAERGLELYRQIFNNASDGITVLDAEARVIERNPAHERMSGLSDEALYGRSIDEFLGAGTLEAIGRGVEEQGRYRGEVVFRPAEGKVNIDLSVFPIFDDAGQIQRFIGMGRDITEHKRMLADLEQANAELKQTQTQLVQSEKMAALGMLVAGIAHEINTPVGAINSTHSTLVQSVVKLKKVLEGMIPEELESNRKLLRVLSVMDESNQVVESAASRVTKIVRRLRSFARLDEAELKKVDLHEGLEDTLTILHHELKHEVEVLRDYDESLPKIPCYPGPLNQVFLNLLMNAKQAITGKGTISISTRAVDAKLHVAITDTGQGMAPETVARIFDPGFTTKGVGVGTGLGLSICYRIMQDHHGEIRVHSVPGEGSTFTVVLPLDLDKILGKDL